MSKFKTDSDFKELISRAEFLRRSYVGGDEYRKGRFIMRHERESEKAYKRRLEQATFTNFCSAIIDAYVSHLYRDAPERDITQFDEEVIDDIDFMGRGIDSFMRQTSRTAGIEGVVGIIVDKPEGKFKTKQEEIDNDIRPYCSVYKLNAFVNEPTYERINGRIVMTEVILREPPNGKKSVYKRWTRNKWELYEQDGTAEPKKVKEGKHSLKVIPLIIAKNRDVGELFNGISDIADIADINRRIYNYESDSLVIIENTAFPMLEMPSGGAGGEEGDAEVGPTNVLPYDADNPAARHAWIEPTGASLKEIRADRQAAIDDIWRISKLGANEANQVSAESGVALEIRFTQLNALLSEKAESMERVETRIFELMALWDGNEFNGSITYPRKFGIRDLLHDIDVAIKALTIVTGKTFKAEIARKIAGQMLKDVDPQVIDAIVKEIEAGSEITTDGLNA